MLSQSAKGERRQWRKQRTEAGAAVAECEGLLPPKHDAGTATRHYRAFWQRRCRAAAAGAVLKPQGGNCAVLSLLPYVSLRHKISAAICWPAAAPFCGPQRGVRCNQALQFFPAARSLRAGMPMRAISSTLMGSTMLLSALPRNGCGLVPPNKKVMFHWVPPGLPLG